MSKLNCAVLVFAIGISSAAIAQTATPDQRGACKTEYEKFCVGTEPGGGRVVACLNKRYAELSDTCRKVLDARKKS